MKHFLRRMVLALLCLALGAGALPARAETVSAAVVTRAIEILATMESSGNYGCVTNDTNGSPSVGILQWNNGRAVSLVKSVIAMDAGTARELLGEAMYAALAEGSSSVWSGVSLSSSERAAVGQLLKTAPGVDKQQALATKDVTSYVRTAMGYGIVDRNALAYYCDIAHQVGSYGVVKYVTKAAALAGSYEKITLKDLYDAACVYATHTKKRRTTVYKMLLSNPVSGSDPSPTPTAGPVKPTGVTLNHSGTVKLAIGETLQLIAACEPGNAQTSLKWASSRSGIASVSQDGLVTAKKAGNAAIAVKTANNLRATVKIVVAPILVESVTLSGESVMARGSRQRLLATCLPENATNRAVSWKSYNPSIVAVNQKGTALAKKRGTALVACRSKDGTRIVAKFQITVR